MLKDKNFGTQDCNFLKFKPPKPYRAATFPAFSSSKDICFGSFSLKGKKNFLPVFRKSQVGFISGLCQACVLQTGLALFGLTELLHVILVP